MVVRRVASAVVAAVMAGAFLAVPTPAQAVKATKYANCTALNKHYAHGVGKPGAKDKVSGKAKPVTNFYKNLALYNANKTLDRDKDGIACEKH